MTSGPARALVGAAMGAGAIGVILALAGVHSPVRTALVLLFLAVAPTAAIAGLLRDFDPFARLVLAVVSTIAMLSIVAMILLSAGLWSPIGELAGVAMITAACLAARRPAVRARVAAWAGPRWQSLLRHIPGARTALPAAGTAGSGHAAPHEAGAGAQAPGNGQAEPDGGEPGTAGSTAGAGSAGPTEATTPLPAVHD